MKLVAVTILLTTVILFGCDGASDDSSEKNCPTYTEGEACPACDKCETCPVCKEGDACPACEQCQKCEVCPVCKEGDACPACEQCQKCEVCPVCKEGDACPACDKSELEKDVKDLTAQLDSCNKELKTLNSKTRSKSGSRLKMLAYKGNDGSEAVLGFFFDTVKNKQCYPTSYKSNGCSDKYYCVSTSDIKSTTEYDKYYLCSKEYDKPTYDNNILNSFSYSSTQSGNVYPDRDDSSYTYYLDANCSQTLSGYFIEDSSCKYKKSDIIQGYYNKQTSFTNQCIDNTSYSGTESVYSYQYYKPKTSSFSTIYRKSGNSCSHVTDKGIILEKLPDVSLEEAKAKRKQYCQEFCVAIEDELKEWVEMTLEPVED